MPVSYTHLDVYKRQIIIRTKKRISTIFCLQVRDMIVKTKPMAKYIEVLLIQR